MLDLALWKEPQSSGAVLGGATLVYFVFEKLRYTALALVSQAMLVLVLGCAMWTAYCRFMNKCAQPPLAPRRWGTHASHLRRRPAPPVPKLEVSEASVRAVVSKCVGSANELLALLYKLGTAQDPKQTAQVSQRVRHTARCSASHALARAPDVSRLSRCAAGGRRAVRAVEGWQLVLFCHARLHRCVACGGEPPHCMADA